MLVLMDRGFDAGGFLHEVAATQAQFLVRLTSTRRPPVTAQLPDGSVLSLIGGVKVRIITATVTVTCHDGSVYGDSYRLATTLTDHRAWPAEALTTLYHERWEHEITYLALRHTLLGGRVLRSGDPAGLEQEMWALLTLYQALRIAVTDAVHTAAGTDPDRASYQIAVQTAQTLVTGARGILTETTDLVGDIGRAVLANLVEVVNVQAGSGPGAASAPVGLGPGWCGGGGSSPACAAPTASHAARIPTCSARVVIAWSVTASTSVRCPRPRR